MILINNQKESRSRVSLTGSPGGTNIEGETTVVGTSPSPEVRDMTYCCSYLLAVLILNVSGGFSGTTSYFTAGRSERPTKLIIDRERGVIPWLATFSPLSLRWKELRWSESQYQWCPEARLGGGYSEDGASDISLDTSLLVARLRGGELKPKGEGNHKNFDMSVNYDSEEIETTSSDYLRWRHKVATNGPRSFNVLSEVPPNGYTKAQDATTTEFVSQCILPTPRGRFRLRAYRHEGNGRSLEPVVLVAGDIDSGEGVPVRVHDQCLTSEVLGSMRCDCKQQLEMAMDYISQHGGCVIYLQQEGRGIGLANKVAAYELQDGGLDTVDANRRLGFDDDLRSYEAIKYILGDMGIKSIKLMTNNPFKIRSLEAMGIKILSRIPILAVPNADNLPYLEAKARRMSHLLHQTDVGVVGESLNDDSALAVGLIRGGKANKGLEEDELQQYDQYDLYEEEGYAFGKDSVLAAIEAVREGKCVVVTDDEDRENEGDIIFAAEKATEDLLAFMIRHTSGVICASLEEDRLEELELPQMVANNQDAKRTAFTITVDAKVGTTTGISAGDRALTLRALSDSKAAPNDFARPGHIFPLRYTDGGVLTRAGHTEAAVDLAKLAGLQPVGVLCEITTEDGKNMARLPYLRKFCAEHGLVLTSIQDMRCFIRERKRFNSSIPSMTRLPAL